MAPLSPHSSQRLVPIVWKLALNRGRRQDFRSAQQSSAQLVVLRKIGGKSPAGVYEGHVRAVLLSTSTMYPARPPAWPERDEMEQTFSDSSREPA